MPKVIIPADKERVKKHIKALKAILPYDDPKSRAIHEKAIQDLENSLKECDHD